MALLKRIEAIENRLSPPETLCVELVKPGEPVEGRAGRMTMRIELSDPGLLGIPVEFHEAVEVYSGGH